MKATNGILLGFLEHNLLGGRVVLRFFGLRLGLVFGHILDNDYHILLPVEEKQKHYISGGQTNDICHKQG